MTRQTPPRALPRRELFVVALFTLATFGIRLIDLYARSYWLDEGFTLYRLFGSWAQIVDNSVVLQGVHTTDIHPPLYFAALKAWAILGGDSEFVLRLFSVVCATLIVPLTYVLGRRMFGAAAGVLAALFALISPAYQWHGWEVRMYTLIPALSALSTYFLARSVLSRHFSLAYFVAWLVTTAVGIFTHYSLASMALAQIIFLLPVLARQLRRVNARYVLVGAVALVLLVALALFLPGPATTVRQIGDLIEHSASNPSRELVPLVSIIHDVLGASVFGMNAADPSGGWLEAAIGALIMIGLLLPLSRQFARRRMLLGLCIFMPIFFWSVLSYFLENRPSFRYVIIVLPMAHVALAYTVSRLLRPGMALLRVGRVRRGMTAVVAGAVALSLVLALPMSGLLKTFARTDTWQDDWRSVANYLRERWQPGDALMINLFTPEAVMWSYLRGVPMDILPAGQWVHTAPREQITQHLRDDYKRIWHANTGGDDGYMSREIRDILSPLARRSRVDFASRTNIIEIDRYDSATQVAAALPPDVIAVPSTNSRDRSEVVGYRLSPGSPFAEVPVSQLTLWWRRGDADPADTNLALRLKHKDGAAWMDWLLPADLAGLPASCRPGTLCRVDYTLRLPSGLPELDYTLEVQVQSGPKQEPQQRLALPLSAAEVGCCIRIVRDVPRNSDLRGSDVDLLRVELPDMVRPGNPLPVVATWQARQPSTPDFRTRVSLQTWLGQEISSAEDASGTPSQAPTAWPAGEPVRDQYALQVPPATAPGLYRVTLQRVREGAVVDGGAVGWVRVEEYPATPVETQIRARVDAQAGEIALLGWNPPASFARGTTYDLHTLWQVRQVPQGDGVLFLHVVGPDGKLVAQDDNRPEQGARSTQTYRGGDGIDLIHRVTIPAASPGGEYTVYAGIYNRSDVQRWEASQNGAAARDNLIKLGTFVLPDLPKMNPVQWLPIVARAGGGGPPAARVDPYPRP